MTGETTPHGDTDPCKDPQKPPFRADRGGARSGPNALIEGAARPSRHGGGRACPRIQHGAIPSGAPEARGRASAPPDGEYNQFLVAARLFAQDRQRQADGIEADGALSFHRRHPRSRLRRPCRSSASFRARRGSSSTISSSSKSITPAGVTAKVTIPSPTIVHFRGGRAAIDAAPIPDGRFLSTTLPPSIAPRLPTGPQAGCRYLQIDEVNLRLPLRSGIAAAGQAISAKTRGPCRKPTPSCSTPRWPASLRT